MLLTELINRTLRGGRFWAGFWSCFFYNRLSLGGLGAGFLITGLGLGGVGLGTGFCTTGFGGGADLRDWRRQGGQFKDMYDFRLLLAARDKPVYEQTKGKGNMANQCYPKDSPSLWFIPNIIFIQHP